jgi:hypothetical protein
VHEGCLKGYFIDLVAAQGKISVTSAGAGMRGRGRDEFGQGQVTTIRCPGGCGRFVSRRG